MEEPKVVVVWSSMGGALKSFDIFTIIESMFRSKQVRVESLDISDERNKKYSAMFDDFEDVKGPKIYIYEDDDADFECNAKDIPKMFEDGSFDKTFEECVETENDNDEEKEKQFEKDLQAEAIKQLQAEANKQVEAKSDEKTEKPSKPMGKYTSKELAAHVVSLTFNDLTKSMIKYKVDGPMLLRVKTPKDVKALLHVDDAVAEGFFELLVEEKEKETAKKLGVKFPEFSDKWTVKPMMKWNLREVKGWCKSFVTDEKEVQTLFKSIDKSNCNGRRLVDHDELTDLCDVLEIDAETGIVQKLIAAIEMQMDKEMDDDEKKDENESEKLVYRIRNFRKYDWIVLSDKEDCIMKYNDDDGIDRAEMGCGHAIAADTLFYYIRSAFTENFSVADVYCPVKTCQKKWDWDTCVYVCDMSDEEKGKYSKIRFKRIHTDLTECPSCEKMVSRPKDLQQFKVRCGVCNSGDFCFNCSLSWKSRQSDRVCGNISCSTVKDLNDTLIRTGWNKNEISCMKGRKDGAIVPKIRACPRCLTLVIHDAACKHMICKGCDKMFCFVCLGLKDKKKKYGERWACVTGDSHTGQCPVAPIQKFG